MRWASSASLVHSAAQLVGTVIVVVVIVGLLRRRGDSNPFRSAARSEASYRPDKAVERLRHSEHELCHGPMVARAACSAEPDRGAGDADRAVAIVDVNGEPAGAAQV